MPTVLVCGAVNWDTICLVDHLPLPGEEVTCSSVSEVPGGTGANAAVAAARILGAGEVALFAALGMDAIADRQLTILGDEGVDHAPIVHIPGESSGHAYIFVDLAGQNVIASSLGANAALNVRHARPARLNTLLQTCRCVALTDPPLPVVSYLLRAAAGGNVPVLWDPGTLALHGWDALAPLARQVDTLFLNEAEAEWLFGTSNTRGLLTSLGQPGGPARLVLKRGARGSLLLDPSDGRETQIPPFPITSLGLQVMSTVGCGDVFLGAYAACLASGEERNNALMLASAAAGLNATRAETRGGPTKAELLDAVAKARKLGFAVETGEERAA